MSIPRKKIITDGPSREELRDAMFSDGTIQYVRFTLDSVPRYREPKIVDLHVMRVTRVKAPDAWIVDGYDKEGSNYSFEYNTHDKSGYRIRS